MQFFQAGYVMGTRGEVKTYTNAYSREISLLWTGMVTERVEVLVDVHPAGETVVRINKDGRQVHPIRALHRYKSEGVAFASVKATMEWKGYTL